MQMVSKNGFLFATRKSQSFEKFIHRGYYIWF
jgi:hypothetical protein